MAKTQSKSKSKPKMEGQSLLGSPTFKELENGRFKCLETGHEMLAKDMDSYSHSKRCRLGLIDFALSRNKPPLNIFDQDPQSRSKLKCKLTGDTVNKSEEHIWKHMSGKRFLSKLEQKEMEKLSGEGICEDEGKEKTGKASKPRNDDWKKEKKKRKDKEKKKCRGVQGENIKCEVRYTSDKDAISEETGFWMPPVGDRWDLDNGGDRWGSGSESDQESQEIEETEGASEEDCQELEEQSKRTKGMSAEIGPSSLASRKKKKKKNHPS